MEKEYTCRICKSKHWCWLNAVECCDNEKLDDRRATAEAIRNKTYNKAQTNKQTISTKKQTFK